MNDLTRIATELIKKGDRFIAAYGPLKFHECAQELLLKAELYQHYSFEDLVSDSFSPAFNQQQNYASFQFSDLPITLAMGEHCFLDLYFWRRRPTVIHDHHFTGAFQCLEGVNVDLEFEFTAEKQIGSFHNLGLVKELHSRKLVKGDIAPIDLLDKFIHQNHHQAELTINVCFRTPDIGETNLSNFLYSGLRYEKHPELLNRSARLMSFLNMGKFDLTKLNLTIDDAFCFLIRSFHSESQGRKFLEARSYMDQLIRNETGIDLDQLLREHESQMDEIEDYYN